MATPITEAVEPSSGNVFADLGVPEPDIALLKAEAVLRIQRVIRRRKLTQADAAKLLGLDQPKISKLVRGRVSGFSLERLLRLTTRLGLRATLRFQSIA